MDFFKISVTGVKIFNVILFGLLPLKMHAHILCSVTMSSIAFEGETPPNLDLLARSSAKTYRDKNSSYVYKVYRKRSKLPYEEILKTKFFQENKLDIAGIVGVSEAVFDPEKGDLVIAKEYIAGEVPSFPRHSKIYTREKSKKVFLDEKIALYEKIFLKKFPSWVKKQELYREFHKIIRSYGYDSWEIKSDLKSYNNWIYTGEKWVLIDP